MLSLGSNISATQVVESKYSANFDGTDEYIDTGHHFSDVFNDSFTISFWVKPDDGQPAGTLYFFGTNDNDDDILRAEHKTDGKFFLVLEGNTDTGSFRTDSPVFSDGAATSWTHILVSVTKPGSGNSSAVIYINGSSVAHSTSNIAHDDHALFSSAQNLVIGAQNNQGTIAGFYAGGMDEWALWNVALDADAAAAIYNSGSPLNLKFNQGNYDNSSALQAYYRMGNGFFDDKANGIIHDQDNPGFGSNLVVNADFSTNEAADQTYLNGGLQFDNWVEQQSSGLRKFELTSDGQGIKCTIETANDNNWNQRIYQDVSSVLTVGDVYEFSVDILCSLARNFEACIETIAGAGDQFAPDDVALSANTRTVIKKVFRCTATSDSGNPMTFHLYPIGDVLPAGEFYEVRNPSLKKLNGNPGLTSGGVTFSSDTP